MAVQSGPADQRRLFVNSANVLICTNLQSGANRKRTGSNDATVEWLRRLSDGRLLRSHTSQFAGTLALRQGVLIQINQLDPKRHIWRGASEVIQGERNQAFMFSVGRDRSNGQSEAGLSRHR